MPNAIVTAQFNPPEITLQGASLRQDTIDALQKALPQRTTTSMPTQRHAEVPKFLLLENYKVGNVSNNATTGKHEENNNNNNNNMTSGAASGPSSSNANANTNEMDSNKYSSWKIELSQHYCDQKGRSMIFLAIMEALEEEGYAMRGVHTFTSNDDSEKDITRMIFARE